MARSHPFAPAASLLAGVMLAASASVAPNRAQAQAAATASFGPYVLERQVRERWVHEAQHPDFVPYQPDRTPIHLRPIHLRRITPPQRDDSRQLQLAFGGVEAHLFLDPTNRFNSVSIDEPGLFLSRYDDARAHADRRRGGLRGSGVTLALPVARIWEVPFVVPPTPLSPGSTWSDTLSFEAAGEGMWERLEGVWRHTVVGDTAVEGRTLPLVATTAELRYRARELTADAAMDTVLEVTRDVSGRMHGRAAVDTAIGVRAAGMDSTLLSGTAVLRMGDGPPLESGIRYDRERRWLLRDSSSWAVMQDSLREEARRQTTGMLMLPRTPLEERLRAGDAEAADSLLALWRATADPNERTSISAALARSDARTSDGTPVEEQLRQLRLEAGDTAGLTSEALRAIGRSDGLSLDVLRVLDDPGRLWRMGILPRFPYIELGTQLLRSTPILEPDTTRWPCRPELCAAAVALVETATEPRLRDAALAGAFARDPARWYDRVLARADSGSATARLAAQLGAGVGATWPASPHAPMPDPDANWRVWLTWMGGEVRFERTHMDALRMFTARTGRDPLEALTDAWPPADDSARLVIGTILRGMDALGEPTAAELRAALLSYSEPDRVLARNQLDRLLRRHGRPAEDAYRLALLRPLLDSIASGGQLPWRTPQGGRPLYRSYLSGFHGVTDVPVFVLDENLPEQLAATLPDRFTLITREEWEVRPRRAGGVLITVAPVLVWEDFATLGLDWRALERRNADAAPSGYAGGGSFVMLRTEEGWRIVSESAWIT